jgi:alkanesulfonate monooxygenase SsuD/methylene tetrahydromethanopterin reductase-like flavin-dependent oxidoreductase (luciferase family)
VTPVGCGARRPSLGLIIPTSTQGELTANNGSTQGTTYAADNAASVAELCRRAETAGVDSLWATDHLFWPHPIAEPMTTLAVAAAATVRPALGTCVLQLPLRQPAAVAKQATALQLLSGGRFVLGLGVGSHEPEYARAGVDFHRRGHLMDRAVAGLCAAWADADLDAVGESGEAPAGDEMSDYRQAPSGSPVPLWFGGASAAARRRAATLGDGWIPLFLTPPELEGALVALRRETEEAGRAPESVEPGVVVFTCVGDDDDDGDQAQARGTAWLSHLYRLPAKSFRRHLVAGSPAACAGALQRFADAGARHLVVMVAGAPAVEHFARLRAAFVDRAGRQAASEQPSLAAVPA